MQCSHRCPGWMISHQTFGWLSQTVRIVGELASSPMEGISQYKTYNTNVSSCIYMVVGMLTIMDDPIAIRNVLSKH